MPLLIAALTYHQELIKEVVGAVATAVSTAILVTILGTLAANSWAKRRDERAARFDIRSRLLDRASATAQEMFTCCGHIQRMHEAHERNSDQELDDLDEAYFKFAADSGALENEPGARYGFDEVLQAGQEHAGGSQVRERWHQIRDLLTVYYWTLRYPTRLDDVFARNSQGADGHYHTGLALAEIPADDLFPTLRLAYEQALRTLVPAMIKDGVTLG